MVAAVGPSLRRAAQEGVHDIDGIVDIHIAQTVEVLLGNSPVIAAEVAAGRCAVVGMSYRLAAGEVRPVAPAHAPAESSALTATVPGSVRATPGADAAPAGEPAAVAG